jgi:Na+-transporting methylmalonyl-CoA/oxaloacetate decarboxylase gamma subunit
MNTQNVIYAFEIMGKGMASIFIVIGILTAIVVLLSKITNKSNLNQDNSKMD